MPTAIDTKQAQNLIKELLSSIKKAKKRLEKENSLFDKQGSVGFSAEADQIASILQLCHDNCEKFNTIKNIAENIPVSELKILTNEYDEFLSIVGEYNINLRAASRTNEILLESTKANVERSAKMDHGYNSDGVFMSDKKILANIPAIAFNNKV